MKSFKQYISEEHPTWHVTFKTGHKPQKVKGRNTAEAIKKAEKRAQRSGEKDPRQLAMYKGIKKVSEEVELDEGKEHPAAAELNAYAKKHGGIDKKDFQVAAGKLNNFRATGSPKAIGDLVRMLNNLDTDPMEKILVTIKKHDPSMARSLEKKMGIHIREETEELDEAVGTSAKYAGKKGFMGGKYTSHDRMLDMKNFAKLRDKRAAQRNAEHEKQDPKHAKAGYAKHMVDMDKAADKAKKKGVAMRDYGKDKWKVRNGVKRGGLPEEVELTEADIAEILRQYALSENVNADQLADLSEEEINEIIGKAIGGAFKLGAKAAVGAGRLAGKAAKKAVMTKQGNIRGTKAAKMDREGDKAENQAKKAEKERAQRDRIKAARERVNKARNDLNKAQSNK